MFWHSVDQPRLSALETPAARSDIIRDEITPKHIIIDPNSMFTKRWDIIMIFCLVFVAFVTPFEVTESARAHSYYSCN